MLTIHDPRKHHHFVVLFEINNADLGGSGELGPSDWASAVKYGLITDATLKGLISHWVTREYGLSALLSLRGGVQRQLLQPILASADPHNILKTELCQYFYDVRVFGLITGSERIPGAIRLSSARSVDPVLPWSEDWAGSYGLYRLHGSYDPRLGAATGVRADDLAVFWKTLTRLFESDPAVQPLRMAPRGVWVFSGEAESGPSEHLLGQVQQAKVRGNPRSFGDYRLRYPAPGPLQSEPTVVLTHWT